MAECNHDCANCSQAQSCESKIVKAKLNDQSHIKKIVGVLSGKGGVGKSFITSLLAVYLNRQGYKVGILDADITGPSIPKAFGIKEKAYGDNGLIYHPARSVLRRTSRADSRERRQGEGGTAHRHGERLHQRQRTLVGERHRQQN